MDPAKRYSHALAIAYEADSDDPRMPTLDEALAGLCARIALLESDRSEAAEALLTEVPFDTYDRLED
jgi:hypothetical protein